MIFGIGTDIVKIHRIETLYQNYKEKFVEKVLSQDEQKIFDSFSLHNRKMSYLAKRFAAKEAFVKALGTGFIEDITFPGISVYNNLKGRPKIKLSPAIIKRLPENYQIDLSLSDETDIVIAYVVVSIS